MPKATPARRQMKMKRETAELLLNSLERCFEALGVSFEKVMAEPEMKSMIPFLPKAVTKHLKYGTDRESMIKYFTTHAAEPSAGERASWPILAVQLPRMLGRALLQQGPMPALPERNYRAKISREERSQVRKEVQDRLKKSKTYAQAINEVAELYGVHTRTIRRLCPRIGGSR